MEKFEYKVGLWSHSIEVAKEMIVYKGKNIPANQIIGIGIGFQSVTANAIGGAFGLVGALVAQKINEKRLGDFSAVTKDVDPNLIPKSIGQVMITYQDSSSGKQKVLRLAIHTKNETCLNLIRSLQKNFPQQLIGLGPFNKIEQALQISHKGIWIFVIVIILLGLGAAIIVPKLANS